MSLPSGHNIPRRFRDNIVAHIALNIADIPGIQVPLILGIHGPAGEGKTAQCLSIIKSLGIRVDVVYSDEFESKTAGDPAARLKNRYIRASRSNSEAMARRDPSAYSIILINDVDQAIGRKDERIQQTINTQLLNKFIMDAADADADAATEFPSRVPIILTGNDLLTLHAPLFRDGRMEKFEWIPNLEERIQIVRGIFHEMDEADVRQLVTENTFESNEFRDKVEQGSFSISSYSAIRYRLYRNSMIDCLRALEPPEIMPFILEGRYEKELNLPIFSLASIREAAKELASQGLLRNHLKERKS